MILFVTMLTVIIWLWAAGSTTENSSMTTMVHFTPPEGSTATITPPSASIKLTLSGPRSAVETAKEVCQNRLDIPVVATDGNITLQDLPRILSSLDVIRRTGAEVTASDPISFDLEIQTMVEVVAAVEPVLPNVIVSGDVTVDPATVTLFIPQDIRDQWPNALTVQAVVSDTALEQLQPGVVHTRDAVIKLPAPLDLSDITVVPSRVAVTFKIQSKTHKTTLQQVRVLLAGPAEDYASYEVTLPRKVVPNVTIEGDDAIIQGINSGNITVFCNCEACLSRYGTTHQFKRSHFVPRNRCRRR